jgi:hypothetical protein
MIAKDQLRLKYKSSDKAFDGLMGILITLVCLYKSAILTLQDIDCTFLPAVSLKMFLLGENAVIHSKVCD